MKRFWYFGLFCFCLGIAVTVMTHHLFADTSLKSSFVRTTEMEWAGQESHGPKTALKWVLGRRSDVEMESLISFWLMTVGPGGYNKLHKHSNEEQIYYILEGEGRMVAEDKEFTAKAGDVGYFPKGVQHGFYNDGESPAIFIGIAAKVEPLK